MYFHHTNTLHTPHTNFITIYCISIPLLVLSIENLASLLEKLWSARVEWYNLGLALGLPCTDLDAIRDASPNRPDDCLREVLKKWLLSCNPSKMMTLIKALSSQSVGFEQLAIELQSCSIAKVKSEVISC